MRKPGALTIAAAAGVAAAFIPLAGRAETVIRPGEPTSNIELGLIGHETPEVLKHARADPYAAPAAPACATIPKEIAALDEVLGPDADTPAQKTKMRARANRLIGQALRGAIPHRDVVRFVTGAERRDKALNQAAMAGWARRGFLKGMEVNLGCSSHAPVEAAAASRAETGEAYDAVAHAHGAFPYATPVVITPAATTDVADPQHTGPGETAEAQASGPPKTPAHRSLLHSVSDAIVGPVKAFVR